MLSLINSCLLIWLVHFHQKSHVPLSSDSWWEALYQSLTSDRVAFLLVAISAIPKIVCETIHALELQDETPSWKIMDNKGRVTVVLHWDQRSGPSRVSSEAPSPAPGKFSPSKRPSLVIQTQVTLPRSPNSSPPICLNRKNVIRWAARRRRSSTTCTCRRAWRRNSHSLGIPVPRSLW